MKDAKWWREYRKKNRDRLRIYDRERKRRNRKPKEEVKPSKLNEEKKSTTAPQA